jgi:hypothetical protein
VALGYCGASALASTWDGQYVGRTPSSRPGRGDAGRPTRAQRRQQRLAAAVAHHRAVRDATLTALLEQYRVAYEQTGQDLMRPAADFIGMRGSRQVVSISSRPASPEDFLERFTLACLTLATLEVDWVALLAGDERALAVTAPADHPSDLALFVVGLTFGPVDVEPAGTLLPYELDRDTGMVTWQAPRPVQASCTHGLWAEVLGPMCLARPAVAGKAARLELLEQNRLVDNEVLLL